MPRNLKMYLQEKVCPADPFEKFHFVFKSHNTPALDEEMYKDVNMNEPFNSVIQIFRTFS